MKAELGFRDVRLMLVAVLVLAPASLLAQQDRAGSRDPSEAEQIETSGSGAEQPGEPADGEGLAEQVDESGDDPDAPLETGPRTISGMSILGNQEAPTSLVIVPWRSSQIGESVGVSTVLDDSREPVDKDVFMRALRYYEIRSESRP